MSLKRKIFSVLILASMAICPMGLFANDCSSTKITEKKVAGEYQFSGFSNSLDGQGTVTQPQSQALVGKAKFNDDGTGTIEFIDFTAIINGDITTIHAVDLPFTFELGPRNGEGTIAITNFPTPGANPVFAASFKVVKSKVVGFSLVIKTNNLITSRWTLIQGERFN